MLPCQENAPRTPSTPAGEGRRPGPADGRHPGPDAGRATGGRSSRSGFADLQQVAVRIAKEAADLPLILDWRGEELGAA